MIRLRKLLFGLGNLLWVVALGVMLYRQWALPQPTTLTMISSLAEIQHNVAIMELHGHYTWLAVWLQGVAFSCWVAAWIAERFGRKLPDEGTAP